MIVFNIVWTGTVFGYLRYFVASQMAHSDAAFRFVANGCPAEEISRMERFAERHADRVVDVLVLSSDEMVNHGSALDAVRARRDDGPYFGLIDPDITARDRFLPTFFDALDGAAAVTSGRAVWSETDVVPEGHMGVNGEYFFDRDGFVFGSPNFAIYRRDLLEQTTRRWGIGFGTGGTAKLADEARERLEAEGRLFWLYDTGKLVNIFLQIDGHELRHIEHPALLHVGGMSHYLSPPAYVDSGDGAGPEPDWARWDGMESRFEVARFSAAVLRARSDGNPVPPVPPTLGDELTRRLGHVRSVLVELVDTYRPMIEDV